MSARNTYEPDVVLHLANADQHRHYLLPDQIVLVVEVVAPGTRRRDRFDKPTAYAQAGIPHYWRVEQDPLHIFAYRLVDGAYREAAESTTALVLDEPFEIRLSLSEITP